MANRKLAEGYLDLFDAITILGDAWNAIPEEESLHSWNHIDNAINKRPFIVTVYCLISNAF